MPGSLSYNFVSSTISFDEVTVATTKTKPYVLKNTHNSHVTYIVTRNTQNNPIYYVFDVNKYEISVGPGCEFTLKLSYTPNIPGSKDFDYFSVVDSLQNFYRLCLKGECIGPSVNCSIRVLSFFQTPKRKIVKQMFELRNTSRVPAIFQFDCNEEEQGVFVVGPLTGNLKPGEHKFVTVKFLPQKPDWYAKQLCCLILHYDPILVNLVGVMSDIDYTPEIALRFYPFPYDETVGFKGYLSDSVTLKQIPPPISLSVNYLDFGQTFPDSSCQTLTTSFTNHMENEVQVEWENTKLFRICPQTLQIPPQQGALYECKFQPDAPCRLSSAVLNAHVMWSLSDTEAPFSTNVPIPLSLRVIGHSFPKNQAWIPSISIVPSCVILPLTLPTYPSWTTFMIETHGHLPILFKLLAPRKTNFVMKPMVGLVRTYQIIAVQLQSFSTEPNSYIEKWSIELNGQVERLTPIYIKAQTDIPRILVGINNVIEFEAMQPGTQTSTYVPIKNISCCHLTFKFVPFDNFTIDPVSGRLAPNEELFVTCIYTSDVNQSGTFEFELTCILLCLYKDDAIIGEPEEIVVTVVARIVYSELCALPQYYDCGEIECGTTIKTNFYLFNFGQSNIFFKLSHDHDSEDVELRPIYGKCGPREKMLVCVQMKIQRVGKHDMFVSYNNRFDQCNKNQLTAEAAKRVFRVEYHCVLATLQIVELVDHNFGHLFSDADVWTLLKIDEINTALRNTNQGEMAEINLSVPDSEQSNDLFVIVFTIKNITNISTRLVLKRRQLCDCKLIETTKSLTFRQKSYNCPHKDMLSIQIASPTVPPQSSQSLSFTIKFSLPYENVLSYILELSNERKILLNVAMNSIPNDSFMLSLLTETLDLGFVYIGLREAPVQAIWLYNNTNKDVPYKLDDLEIVKMNNRDGFPVLKCLNCDGFLKAHTSAPILFRFWPIEIKTYRVLVPLQLGLKQVVVKIEGFGTDQTNKPNFDDVFSLASQPTRNKMIGVSMDQLMIEPILVGSSTERLIFMKNLSKTQELRYKWKPCLVDGLVDITTTTLEGSLQPLEGCSVVVTIKSLNESCKLRMLLHCELMDIKKYSAEQELYESYLKRRRSSALEFIYSDGEPTNKSPEVEIVLEPPVPEYFSIAVPIFLNVVGILDRDNCVRSEDQMKLKPFDRIEIDADKFYKQHFAKTGSREVPEPSKLAPEGQEVVEKDMILHVLENMVSDAVFSDYFLATVKNLKTEPSPVYSQIQLDPKKRKEQRRKGTKKFVTQPSLGKLNEICGEAMIESVHEVFKLGPILKNQPNNSK